MTTTTDTAIHVGMRITDRDLMRSLPEGTRIRWHGNSGTGTPHVRIVGSAGTCTPDPDDRGSLQPGEVQYLANLVVDGSYEIVGLPTTELRVWLEPTDGWRLPGECSSKRQVLDMLAAAAIQQAHRASVSVSRARDALRGLGWEEGERYHLYPVPWYGEQVGATPLERSSLVVLGNLDYADDSRVGTFTSVGYQPLATIGTSNYDLQYAYVWQLWDPDNPCGDEPMTQVEMAAFKQATWNVAQEVKSDTGWCEDLERSLFRAGIIGWHGLDEATDLLTPDQVALLPEGTMLRWDGGLDSEVFIRDNTSTNPARVRSVTGRYDYAPLLAVDSDKWVMGMSECYQAQPGTTMGHRSYRTTRDYHWTRQPNGMWAPAVGRGEPLMTDRMAIPYFLFLRYLTLPNS